MKKAVTSLNLDTGIETCNKPDFLILRKNNTKLQDLSEIQKSCQKLISIIIQLLNNKAEHQDFWIFHCMALVE